MFEEDTQRSLTDRDAALDPIRSSQDHLHVTENNLLSPEAMAGMIGKYILIGITYAPTGDSMVPVVDEVHGEIVSASSKNVEIVLKGNHDGERFSLPPDMRFFHVAPRGIYTLKSTGEKVENPDFTCTTTVHEGHVRD